jgi:tetratricopeptide (TPR) repeat protein
MQDVQAAWLQMAGLVRREALAAATLGMSRLFEDLGRWDEGVAVLGVAREALQSDYVGLAMLDYGQALLHYGAGRFAEAASLARQALRALRRHGGPGQFWGALNVLSLASWQRGRLQAAAHGFAELVQLARAAGNAQAESKFLNNAAIVAKAQGRFEDALAGYQRSMALDDAAGTGVPNATTLNNLGNLYRALGRPREAIDTLRRGLQALTGRPHGKSGGYLLCNLGLAQFDTGDLEGAQGSALLAHQAIGLGGEPALAASVDLLLARVALHRGDFMHALALLAGAAQATQARAQAASLLDAMMCWGEWLQHRGRAAEGEAVLAMVLAEPACSEPTRRSVRRLRTNVEAVPTTLQAALAALRATAATEVPPPAPA